MSGFEYFQPTRIFFGAGAFEGLGKVSSEIGADRILLVCGGSSMRKRGFLDEALNLLSPAETEVFEGVEQDPCTETVDRIADACRGCQLVVGLGGGSVLDAAKAAAAAAASNGETRDFIGAGKKISASKPFIAVPSTAGTGSEVTRASVITDNKAGVKKTLRSPLMFPYAAVVDPMLTMSCPPNLTAAAGVDALSHAIESYTSRLANPVSESFSIKAAKLIIQNLPQAFEDGSCLRARENMSIGSLAAGLALNAASSGVAHRIAHAVGGRFHAPHGIILAQLLPHVMEYNMAECKAKMDELARETGFDSAQAMIQGILDLTGSMGLPQQLSEFGVTEKDIPWIAGQSMKSASIRFNGREVTGENLTELLCSMIG